MRTCVRADRRSGGGHHPARRPGRVLRLRRAAGRPVAARPAGDRRRRGGARGQLRGEGAVGCAPRWAAGRRCGSAPTRRSSAPGCGPTPRPARPCSRSSGTPRRWSRACRWTRRSWTWAGCAGCAARRWTSPATCAARCATGWGCRSRSAWPARSSWPRWPAPSGSPTGCWWSTRAGEREFLHPLPVERLWGVGKVTSATLHRLGVTTVAEIAALSEPELVSMLGAGVRPTPARTRALPRPAAGAHRAPARLDRLAVGARAVARSRRPPSTPCSSRIVDRVTGRMRAAKRVGRTVTLRIPLRRLHQGHPLAPRWRCRRRHRRVLDTGRALLRRGHADGQ